MKKSELKDLLIEMFKTNIEISDKLRDYEIDNKRLYEFKKSILDKTNIESIIHLEFEVKEQLKKRGFEDEVILKNRGLISAAIEETAFRIIPKEVDYSKD